MAMLTTMGTATMITVTIIIRPIRTRSILSGREAWPTRARASAMHYLNDPDAIYRQSFAAIRAEADLSSLPEDVQPIAIRLIHSCGMTDLLPDLRIDRALPK